MPIGESLRLWSELAEHHAAADGTTIHRFLYYPDENHWVLKPQHAVVWYQTVFAFLDEHVHGEGLGAAGAARADYSPDRPVEPVAARRSARARASS